VSKEREYIEIFIGGDIYNLQLTCLTKFREKFGVSINGIDENEFIAWARGENIKFHKEICVGVIVDIDEYLKE